MRFRDGAWGYFFILPNLFFLALFLIYPLLRTFYLSLFEADIYLKTFVGFNNYISLFHEERFVKSFVNTFYFVIIIVPITVGISLIFAAMMQGFHKHAKSFFRLVFYLPVVSTPVVLSLVWAWIYNPSFGIFNYFLREFGFQPIDVFSNQLTAILALAAVVITWMIGQPIILYLSSMDGISKDLFESAEMDGANSIQTFIKITLPLIANTTILIVITSTISVFQIFTVVYLLTKGGPFHGTESLVYTIYQTAFIDLEFGKASAQSVVLFFIIMLIAVLQFRILRSKGE
ncbi:sugar ABC transporter permease [Paenibacillus sp. FSL H7-0331]|uniref:carbohydrate ABC transporter permease n=1 Tax=Paenibacillus sp. FSL H7-0331 TaxID=1920421 RepID=UPI00096FB975|nr:hypothetical protein BK127_30710 [Paenibacillus sp. FSL H7-0331]